MAGKTITLSGHYSYMRLHAAQPKVYLLVDQRKAVSGKAQKG
jgi:hypothetical protein